MDVVLVDEQGQPVGSAPKNIVHTAETPLHLAFSCHVLNGDGEVLMTRRALSKKTWPGVWTNSFCGHPTPGESITDALTRHARGELGATLEKVSIELPDFRYRAVDASGVVENEVCPVFTAHLNGGLTPHPAEVLEYRWVSPSDLRTSLTATPWAFSPWLTLQAPLMELYSNSTAEKG